jgi:hypothetical protein
MGRRNEIDNPVVREEIENEVAASTGRDDIGCENARFLLADRLLERPNGTKVMRGNGDLGVDGRRAAPIGARAL